MAIVYDSSSPETKADPFPLFHRLQSEEPVHYCEALGGWMVTRYADVVTALRDPRLSSDRVTPYMRMLPDAQRTEMDEL